MIKVCSSQYSFQYGKDIRFPYSIALLVAYSKVDDIVNKNFFFEKTFISRESIEEDIVVASSADILLCSNYVWNWEINLYLAAEVKKRNSECLIVFGGPNIPSVVDEHFFLNYPSIDVLVHGEGEIAVRKLLLAYWNNTGFSLIPGVETRNFSNGLTERVDELDTIPSPYLSNLVWDLTPKKDGYHYVAALETNRGCPFKCSFCAWSGEHYRKKMRVFSIERVKAEIEWFADNQISYVACCDSNFGIFVDRDLQIAKKLGEVKKNTGYPVSYNTSWMKTSSPKIVEIANELKKVDLLRGLTLSLQSVNQKVLENVHRKNVSLDDYDVIARECRKYGIQPYIEIICGLPGETVQSFKDGLARIMNVDSLGAFYIYKCSVLNNAEINSADYMKKFNIEVLRSPVHMGFIPIGSVAKNNELQEWDSIILSSSSFTTEELKEMSLYGWAILTFYTFGILEYVSKYFKHQHKIDYTKFFELFLEYSRCDKGIFGEEYKLVNDYITSGYKGEGWDHYDPSIGDITWYIEQASWLRLTRNSKLLFREIKRFLIYAKNTLSLQVDNLLLEDLISFQLFLLTIRDNLGKLKKYQGQYDWKKYFQSNGIQSLTYETVAYSYKNPVVEKDVVKWIYETMWYGRGRRKYKTSIEILE